MQNEAKGDASSSTTPKKLFETLKNAPEKKQALALPEGQGAKYYHPRGFFSARGRRHQFYVAVPGKLIW